jgi:hypothetical protein
MLPKASHTRAQIICAALLPEAAAVAKSECILNSAAIFHPRTSVQHIRALLYDIRSHYARCHLLTM